jgi:signal transduction histidine kinase/ligand-binding sensor domain-containing protein/CheY-like chemotaxis protein
VQVTGAGEELENDIKKETNFNRSPMPWGPLDPPQKFLFGFAVFTFFFFFSMVLYSQAYLVHKYSEEDGLPSVPAYDVTQDPWGRMWFAIRSGIAVYDGVSWKSYTVSDGLPSIGFSNIKADQKGRIWAISGQGSDGIIEVYHDIHSEKNKNNKTRWIKISESGTEIGKFTLLTSLQLLEQNQEDKPVIAVGTNNSGIWLWNVFNHRGKWKNLTTADGLPHNNVNGIAVLNGKFYAATDRGLSVIRIINNTFNIDNQLNQSLGLPPKEIKGICIEHKDKFPDYPLTYSRIWLSGNQWVGYFDEKSFKITLFPKEILFSDKNQSISMLPDYCGGRYMGVGNELNYFNYKTRSWQTLGVENGLAGSGVNSIFIDYEKNIWMPGDRGVSKISSRRFSVFQRAHGLLEDEVSALMEYEPGKYFLGHNFGFTLYDGKAFQGISFPRDEKTGAASRRVLDIQSDSKGNIWIANSLQGLAKINTRSPRDITWYSEADGLPGQVMSIWIDKNQNDDMWVGTIEGIFKPGRHDVAPSPGQNKNNQKFLQEGPGGTVFSKRGWRPQPIHGQPDGVLSGASSQKFAEKTKFQKVLIKRVPPGRRRQKTPNRFTRMSTGQFPIIKVRKLYLTREKSLYIGSMNKGVYEYTQHKNQWKNYQFPGNRRANQVYALKRDSRNRLLIGTLAGLFILENETLKKFTVSGFQVGRPVYFILEDPKNRLWFGTDNGVIRWDGKTPRNYSTAQGLIGHETNRAAGIVDSKGRVWIGTNRSVSFYDEQFDTGDVFNPPPRVRFLSLEVSDRFIPFAANIPVRLGYDNNTIAFHFRGISFLNERSIRFKHKLEGFETKWSQETYPYNQRVQYNKVPPGTYRFHLKARNALGIWSDVVTSPKITIMPPFYRTWWFLLLVVLLGLGIFFGIFRFISQKRYAAILEKQVEERTQQLEAAHQRLMQAQKMEAIGTLAGGIAHDFNNILGAILGYTELVLDDAPGGTLMQKNAQRILRATQRAAGLVKQILAFSRQSKQELKPLVLGDIIKEALKLYRSSLPATIEILQKIKAHSGVILGDPTQIHQVMMNLCANAAHAMKETRGILEISLDEVILDKESLPGKNNLKPGAYLRLTVSDTGHGIPRAVMERIFEPYFTTKKTGEGTGMGLAVIHGIIKNHNGDISVYSEPGKGTIFHLFFPKIRKKTEIESKLTEKVPGGSEGILLVDDEKALTEMGAQMLERLGYEVEGISNALSALETFRREPDRFQLVISDLTMPHMTGIQLAEEIKKIKPDIPIIICSGYSASLSEEQINALGISDFIMKPIVKSELAQVVRRVLDRQQKTDDR